MATETPESMQANMQASREHTDTLPEDLDITDFVGPYLFPDNNRRRWPGLLYLLVGSAMVVAWLLRTTTPVNVNRGVLIGGVLMILVGLYHFVAAKTLKVREVDALVAASAAVGFPVGHASAQLSWRGLLSRPTWRILLYSAEEPPKTRGIALVDGSTAEVLTSFTEENPEDWTIYADDGKLTAS
jgi:hypothetical protein